MPRAETLCTSEVSSSRSLLAERTLLPLGQAGMEGRNGDCGGHQQMLAEQIVQISELLRQLDLRMRR